MPLFNEEQEPVSIDRRVVKLQAELKDEAKALTRLATTLTPLTRPKAYEDLGKIPSIIQKVEKGVAAISLANPRAKLALDLVRDEVAARKEELRQRLAKDLKEACEQGGLGFNVLSREEPVEVRIPPFSVLIDREKGRAEISFAKQSIQACAATATAILDAHQKALRAFTHGFDAERFFEACFRAWSAARGAGLAGSGDRVEILEFLPYLALQLQSRSFRMDPSAQNYRGYTRARFSFDLNQLRKAGRLTLGSRRLNLGVATGTTASKKNRAVWVEDENGSGEYKLTIFFTQVEGK